MTTGAFFRSTRVVLFGMAVAQAIPLLGSLLIARLYVPAEFGAFSTWLGVVMTAAVLVTGRLEMALVIEADGEPRRFAMAATLATICGAVAVLFVLLLGACLVVSETRPFTPGLVLAFLPATLLMAVAQTWQSWAAAEGLYRALSWIRIAQALGGELTVHDVPRGGTTVVCSFSTVVAAAGGSGEREDPPRSAARGKGRSA